jgi:hypothetical protein
VWPSERLDYLRLGSYKLTNNLLKTLCVKAKWNIANEVVTHADKLIFVLRITTSKNQNVYYRYPQLNSNAFNNLNYIFNNVSFALSSLLVEWGSVNPVKEKNYKLFFKNWI